MSWGNQNQARQFTYKKKEKSEGNKQGNLRGNLRGNNSIRGGKKSKSSGKGMTDYSYPILNQFDSAPEYSVHTAGYTAFEPSQFVAMLMENEISYLVDVRIRPFSKFRQEYNSSNLKTFLSDYNIEYLHYIELGNIFKDSAGDENFSDLETPPFVELMRQGGEIMTRRLRNLIEQGEKVCILCACENWQSCHRNAISGYLRDEYNYHVTHL